MILGLTDKGSILPSLGELRKGAPKPERGPGRDLGEHFRFTSDDPAITAAFAQIYGMQPTQMRVFIPYNSVEEAFDAWKEEYSAGGLKHRCDGKTCVLWLDEKGEYHTNPIPCPGGCKATGRLRVWIPELGRRGVVTVLTTSIHDIMNLHGNLLDLQDAAGKLRGIPFILRRVAREISTPQTDKNGNRTGKRARREKWLIAIEPETAWVNLLSQAQQQQALSGLRGLLGAAPSDLALDGDEDEADEYILDPIQSASDELISLYEEMKNVWTANGKKIDGWIPWREKHCDGKTIEQVRAIFAKWPKPAPNVIEAEVIDATHAEAHDDLLISIEREKNGLRLELITEQEIDEKVMKITSGEALESCTAEVLTDIFEYLQQWSESLKQPLAKTA